VSAGKMKEEGRIPTWAVPIAQSCTVEIQI